MTDPRAKRRHATPAPVGTPTDERDDCLRRRDARARRSAGTGGPGNGLFESLPWLTRKVVGLTARIEAGDRDTADLLYGDLMRCCGAWQSAGLGVVRAVTTRALRQLITALTAVPFDPMPGHQLGFDLISARITSPRALGFTVAFLGRELIPRLGIDHPQALARLAVLPGQRAAGFTEAMRNATLAAAESISRAERTAWRNQQVRLHRQQPAPQ